MPAETEAKRKLFGAALAAKRGAKPISKKVADIASNTSEKELSKMASKPKKVKKENIDGSVGQLFVVTKPQSGCAQDGMVQMIDPLVGLSGSEIVPDQVHGVYQDEEMAHSIAETLCQECMQYETMLEEKKSTTTEKIKKAINKLEAQRKEHVKMATENPKSASEHKQHVAALATKIDDLMTKLEKVEKSKKQLEKPEEDDKKKDKKENLKESASKTITLVDKLTATPKGGGDNITIAKGEKVTAGKRLDKEPNAMSITYKGKQYTVTAGPFMNKYMHNKKDKK